MLAARFAEFLKFKEERSKLKAIENEKKEKIRLELEEKEELEKAERVRLRLLENTPKEILVMAKAKRDLELKHSTQTKPNEQPIKVLNDTTKSKKQAKQDKKNKRGNNSPPFPAVLGKKPQLNKELKELFDKVEVNVPLLQAIQDCSTYMKFLKDSLKYKEIFKIEENASIEFTCALQKMMLLIKRSDPGVPYVQCMIGKHIIKKALLDLGSSINMIHLALCKEMGPIDISPCNIRLHLANNSVVQPIEIIEDIIIKVEDAFFSVDFVVLELEARPIQEHTVILGRP